MVATTAQPPNMPPVVTAGFASEAPAIDGRMDDACWRDAAAVAPFVLLGTADLPSQRTLARICTDGNNIFVGFWCWEDRMDALRTRASARDSDRAWSDDCVEVFLAPDGVGDVYYHIIVTAANVVTDEMRWNRGQRSDVGWSFGGRTAVRRLERGWTCELSIPRYTLGASAITGTWLANFARGEQPHGEWSAWPSLLGGFHEVSRFGLLRWQATPAVTQLRLDPIRVGRNSVDVALAEELDLRLKLLRGDRTYAKPLVRQDDGWQFVLHEEGDGYLRIEAWNVEAGTEREELCFATPPLHFSIPEASRPLATAKQWLDQASRLVGGLKPRVRDALARRLWEVRREQVLVAQDIAVAKLGPAVSNEAWDELYTRAEKVKKAALYMLAQVRAAGRSGADRVPSFGLGWQTSLIKLRREDTRVKLGGPIMLSAARDEWESAQLVILPFSDGVRVQAVRVTALHNQLRDATIRPESVRIWRVGWVHTRPPAYPVDYVGWWPDPLMPLEPFPLKPGSLQPLWLSIYILRGTPPGLYTGEIEVLADDGTRQSWPIQVNVWDFDLPRPGRLRTAFSILQRHDVCRWYGFKGLPPKDFRLKLYTLLFEHRLNPMSLYTDEMWPPREDLPWCIAHGLNAFNIRTVNSSDRSVIGYVKAQAEWLRRQGWLPLAYIYGFDEVRPEHYEDLRRAYAAVRRAVPNLKRACTVAPTSELEGYVDIWVPLTARYDHSAAEKRRRAGEEVWWYICCGPWHPYCNWFIDYPATDARILFWQTFKYGVTGFLYYEIAMWRTNLITKPSPDGTQIPPAEQWVRQAIASGKRWPDIPWNTFTFSRYNGDGLLIYPGKNQTPLPSLRLEIVRDGIEDYETLALLADAREQLMASPKAGRYRSLIATAAALASVRPHVVRDLTHYTSDPGVILREREAVARVLLRVLRALRE